MAWKPSESQLKLLRFMQLQAGVLRWAAEASNITALTELGGGYQYEIMLIARNVSELGMRSAKNRAKLGFW